MHIYEISNTIENMVKGRQVRVWHPNFVEYMKLIVEHPNYAGMPHPYKRDGSIRWVVTANSKVGRDRMGWWDNKREELNIEKLGPWRSKVAKAIHPTGEKPCQICGRVMKIRYVYPTIRTISKLNSIEGLSFEFNHRDFLAIEEIIDRIIRELGNRAFTELKEIFGLPAGVPRSKEEYLDYILENCWRMFSPGAMSDAPDRFDGFHSYNICCRKREDIGRHEEKMAKYVEDRRAYECWTDGDWKASFRLMGEFRKCEKSRCSTCGRYGPITADHIGPLSLGFSQRVRPRLRPMCRKCNSARRNMMALDDVQILLNDEAKGEKVVSWHSKYTWDKLKLLVKSDEDAKKLSDLMRRNMHHALIILAEVAANGFSDFLRRKFLKPEYAYYDIEYQGFDPSTGEYKRMVKKKGSKKQYENNAKRYIRKSFGSLRKYKEGGSRRVFKWNNAKVDELVKSSLKCLRKGEETEALKLINGALNELAEDALSEFLGA